jgi:hypothetical protein
MTGFVHPHQKERHDEADGGPLETSNGQFHPGSNSTERTPALNKDDPNGYLPGNFELPLLFGDS